MPAPSAVGVILVAVGRPGVTVRMICVHRDHVLIDVIAVRVMQVAFVEVVDVVVVAHPDVTTPFGVDVLMFALMNGM
jgi:hypothetical protein